MQSRNLIFEVWLGREQALLSVNSWSRTLGDFVDVLLIQASEWPSRFVRAIYIAIYATSALLGFVDFANPLMWQMLVYIIKSKRCSSDCFLKVILRIAIATYKAT